MRFDFDVDFLWFYLEFTLSRSNGLNSQNIAIIGHCTKDEVFHYRFLQKMWPNPQKTANLVMFTGTIFNGKFHFCAAGRRKNLNWLGGNFIYACHNIDTSYFDVIVTLTLVNLRGSHISKTLDKIWSPFPFILHLFWTFTFYFQRCW